MRKTDFDRGVYLRLGASCCFERLCKTSVEGPGNQASLSRVAEQISRHPPCHALKGSDL